MEQNLVVNFVDHCCCFMVILVTTVSMAASVDGLNMHPAKLEFV